MIASTTSPTNLAMRTFALPTSVEIYNIVWDLDQPEPLVAGSSAETKKTPRQWTRPVHSLDLLQRIRLEIHVSDAFVSRAIYSQATNLPRVHSSWKHIEDAVAETSVTLDDGESLWLSFFVEGKRRHVSDGSADDNPTHPFPSPFLQVSLENLVRVHQEIDTDILPVNAVLIKYRKTVNGSAPGTSSSAARHSAGATSEVTATRIPLSLYELLVERSILNDSSSFSSPGMLSSKFDDRVFKTLDSVVPSPARQRIESLGGLGDLGSGNLSFASTIAMINPMHDSLITKIVTSIGLQQDESEVEHRNELAALLQQEQQALEHEFSLLQRRIARDPMIRTNLLLDLCQDIANTDSQTVEVHQASVQLQNDLSKDQFLLESQRIRFVRDLSCLFPIATDATNGDRDVCYRIRGLQLPNSAQGLWVGPMTVADDEVSAGLGYTVLVLNCLSQCLSVDMRHSMWFQSSRSAIQDAMTGAVYPLFTARQDREKFVAGWELVDSNVNRLVMELQLPVLSSKPMPLLAKIQRLYQAIIGGTLRMSVSLGHPRLQTSKSLAAEAM
jgi:hypothetical protein